MKNVCKNTITACLVAFTVATIPMISAQAASTKSTKFPLGCKNTGYHYEYGYLVLQPGYQRQDRTLYFIKNNSSSKLELKSVKDPNDLFMPEYDQKIPKRQWGAFAMEKPNLHFQCIEKKGKHEVQAVNCENRFAICQYDYAKFPHASMGTYWLEKTGNLRQTMRTAIRSGILLRWK